MNEFLQSDFFRLRPEVKMAVWLAMGLAVIVVMDQIHYWQTNEEFSFGYLVPVFVVYVLYERWPPLRKILLGGPTVAASGAAASAAASSGQPRGLTKALNIVAMLTVAGSLLFFMVGGFLRAVTGPDTDSASMLALGLGGFILAMGYLVTGTDAAGGTVTLKQRCQVVALLVFPALAWLISAPMLLVFESRVKPVLLEYVVRIVSGTFDFLGYEVIREGSVLVLPSGSVGVADACSGIRSLTACMFAGSFLAAIFLDKFWRKILLLVLAAVLAFGMNIVRSMFLTGWAYAYGSDMLDADFWGHPEMLKDSTGAFIPNPAFHLFTVHDFAGYSILLCTLAGLLLLLPVLSFKFELDDEPTPPPAPNVPAVPPPTDKPPAP